MRRTMVNAERLGIVVLAIVLVALLVITACAPEPIVEEKTVQLGWINPLTGGGAATSQMVLWSMQDYVRYFNEEKAIPGVRIELLWRDTALQVALGISHYRSLVAAGVPLIFLGEPGVVAALKENFSQDKVVAFLTGIPEHGVIYPDPVWCYSISATTAEQAGVLLEYFMEKWGEERPPRVAFVHVDHAVGYAVRYATGYARELGFEVLPPEIMPILPLDTTVQLLRLKGEGADLVLVVHQADATGVILRDLERLGLVGEFQFGGTSLSLGDRTIKMAGAAVEGFLVPRPYRWFSETEVPGIKLMIDNEMQYRGKVTEDSTYMTCWVGGAAACEAIRRAIENVGYENLDGLAIKEGLDGIKDFDVYGVTSITYKPGDHRGCTKYALYEVRGGQQVRISDWREAPFGRDWVYG